MSINREWQRALLTHLASIYPDGAYVESMQDIQPSLPEHARLANLQYLDGHGLIESGMHLQRYLGPETNWIQKEPTVITPRGIDFISDDGGLTAILGVVTVRLDAEQWRELLATRVESIESLTHDQRSELGKAIRNLPAKALEKVSDKLLDWAVEHAADALPLLRSVIAPYLS